MPASLIAKGSPQQKIGRAIREMNRQLKEVDRTLRLSHKLKTETKAELWGRTSKSLFKMEQKLQEMLYKMRDLRR